MAKYVSENGIKAIRDWTKEQDYKSLYNLGAYDTITANSDGSYTITRQTGYIVLDGVKHKFVEGFSSGVSIWNNYDIVNYVLKPTNNETVADIICNSFKTYTSATIYTNNIYGISVRSDGVLYIGLTTSIKNLTEANAYLVQNPISIQYKLATATTERVEKNHYARYNERFILEHNKNEAERSANLLDDNLILFLEASCKSVDYPNFLPVTLKAGTYTLSYSGITKTSGIWLVELDNEQVFSKDLVNTSITFKCNTQFKFKFYCGENMNGAKFMLNEGDHPYPYQAYNGKIVHDKDIADLYKQEYNLGYYDTMVENSDGTYTITRQTGYVDLSTFDWTLDGDNRFYNRCGLDFEMPSTNGTKPNIISAKYSAITKDEYEKRLKIGISISYSSSIKTIFIYDTNYNDVNAFKLAMQGVILQYKLATATTEKVEKNHYARYNQRFILEHNKSEAERSANLLTDNVFASLQQIKNINYTANGSIITINTTNADDPYLYFKNCFTLDKETTITLSLDNYNNIQMFGIVVNGDSTFIVQGNNKPITFTLSAGTYGLGFETLNVGTNTYKVMLNEGSVALPYQPYNQNKHITNYEALFLKTESDRSANLFDDNGTNSIQYIGHFYTNDSVYNYDISPNDNYNCFRIRVEQNKTYYIKRSDGLILRFENINNNLIGGLSFVDIGYGGFTTPNGCNYVVFSKNISSTTNVTMFNEGTTPLPYQPYEGKVVHEKGLGGYLPLTGGVINANGTKAPLILKGGAGNYRENLRLIARSSDNSCTLAFIETGKDELNGMSANSWAILVKNGGFYIVKGTESYNAPIKLTNIAGTWKVNDDKTLIHEGNIATHLTNNLKTINGNSIVGSGDMSISGTIPIYNVTQLYKHDYEIENQVGDTIYVHCWSTQNTKIKLYDITAYAFSNIQVYNTSNAEAINVLKWETSGFYYIADNGTIAGNSYTVIHYYINGEPTTY